MTELEYLATISLLRDINWKYIYIYSFQLHSLGRLLTNNLSEEKNQANMSVVEVYFSMCYL